MCGEFIILDGHDRFQLNLLPKTFYMCVYRRYSLFFVVFTYSLVFDSIQTLLHGLFNYTMYRYMAANQKCKDADGTIKIESKNVEHLTKVVEEKFKEVHVCYSSSFSHMMYGYIMCMCCI